MKHTQTPLHSILLHFTVVYTLEVIYSISFFSSSQCCVMISLLSHTTSASRVALNHEKMVTFILWNSTKVINQNMTYSLLIG